VYENGVTYSLASTGIPASEYPRMVKPGLLYTRSGSSFGYAGYILNKKWHVKNINGVFNGSTPDGFLTGQYFHGSEPDPRDNYATAYIFNPVTGAEKEIEIGRYTWCWGGNSKGQFILESDSFDNYVYPGGAFMYDMNEDKVYAMAGVGGNTWRPNHITDAGKVYGQIGGEILSWSKQDGLKSEYFGINFTSNARIIADLPNGLLFGDSGNVSDSNKGGFFFLQNGQFFDLNDQVIGGLLPAGYDKWTNYCYMTPEGVIMQALQNSATGKFETHMLTPVPEPATLAALGLGALLLRRRRRQTKS